MKKILNMIARSLDILQFANVNSLSELRSTLNAFQKTNKKTAGQ